MQGKVLREASGVDGAGGADDDAGEVVLVGVRQEVVTLPQGCRCPCVHREGEPYRHLDRHLDPSLSI